MPTTTNYGWTYPDSSGSAQIWTHFTTLAGGIDTSLKTVTDAITPPAVLTDYSATFTVTTGITNPTKGNSVYVAKYAKVTPHLLFYSVKITIGSTWVSGSGDYAFLVPFAMDTTITQILPAVITDGGTAFRTCQMRAFDSTHLQAFRTDQPGAVGSTGPGTAWAAGDAIEFAGTLWLA